MFIKAGSCCTSPYVNGTLDKKIWACQLVPSESWASVIGHQPEGKPVPQNSHPLLYYSQS